MNKEAIISHCRQMDKSDVYEWIAEDEFKIKDLQQRIDKAIEYINKYKRIYDVDGSEENMLDEFNILASPKKLIEILGDKNE
jgi:hypothetical protein